MSGILSVSWRILPECAPRPLLTCAGCGTIRPFASSGRARVNASGKRVDVWLIYRCTTCEATWNRPVLERKPVREIDPERLDAFQRNCPSLLGEIALDADDLRTHARDIEEFGAVIANRHIVAFEPGPVAALLLRLDVPYRTGLRLDRLLCGAFNISRSHLARLDRAGYLTVEPGGGRRLRRPLADRTLISFRPPDGTAAALFVGAGYGVVTGDDS